MADDKDNPGFNPDAPKDDDDLYLGPTDPTAGLAAEFGAMEDQDKEGSIPAVAESNTKNMAIVGFGIILVLFLMYQLFSGEEEVTRTPIQGNKSTSAEQDIVKVKEDRINQREFEPIPPPPPEPPPEQPAPPPPPPAPPITSSLPPVPNFGDDFGETNTQTSLALRERITSPMIISGGGGIGDAIGRALEGGAAAARRTEKLDETSAPQVDATQSGNPFHAIYQGKLIDAVLESAINTELPGTIRAVVSRDVYAEAGRNVMIPKGSRLIGSYDAEVVRGQGRVFMVWDRVIRPDGVDVALRSPVTDNLGRAGVEGEVDNRFVEVLSNSLLLSAITIGVAQISETVTGAEGTTTNETDTGSVLTTGDVVSIATTDAIDDFGDNMSSIVDEFIDGRPIITIPQGQSIKVFVNRDLLFPSASAQGVRIIQ